MIEGGEHLKPRAGPSLEVFRVMFLLTLTITFLLSLTLSPVFLAHLDFLRRCASCGCGAAMIYEQPPLSLKLFDPFKVAQICVSIFFLLES